jgi:hypothetical protein
MPSPVAHAPAPVTPAAHGDLGLVLLSSSASLPQAGGFSVTTPSAAESGSPPTLEVADGGSGPLDVRRRDHVFGEMGHGFSPPRYGEGLFAAPARDGGPSARFAALDGNDRNDLLGGLGQDWLLTAPALLAAGAYHWGRAPRDHEGREEEKKNRPAGGR